MSSKRKKMKFEYDIEMEVTEVQYQRLVKHFPRIIAHRRDFEKDKYYVTLFTNDRVLGVCTLKNKSKKCYNLK